MTDADLTKVENKYFNILYGVFSKNIAKILNQSYSQNMQAFTTYGTANPIEHAIENIVEEVIAFDLNWPVCSVPISSDSCYECGDAILYLDAKTILETDPDAINEKVNIQASQTSYDSSTTLHYSTKTWNASVDHFAQHKVFGKVPNITYVMKFIYYIDPTTNEYLIKKIQLISIPNGQLFSKFGNGILGAGRSLKGTAYLNMRFLIGNIKSIELWRVKDVYNRK